MKMFGSWRKETAPPAAEQAPFSDAQSSAGKQGHPLIGQGRKMLVVDDNPIVLKAFQLKMKSLGFTVFTATEGAAAVSCVRHEKPDVIVLDVNFPPDVSSSGLQWNGFTIMQWMRRFEEAAKTPVIIISSEEPAKVQQKSLAAGAIAFFHKPINNEEFVMTLRRVIGQAPKNTASSQPAAAA